MSETRLCDTAGEAGKSVPACEQGVRMHQSYGWPDQGKHVPSERSGKKWKGFSCRNQSRTIRRTFAEGATAAATSSDALPSKSLLTNSTATAQPATACTRFTMEVVMEKETRDYKGCGMCPKCSTLWTFTYPHVVLSMLCPKCGEIVPLFAAIEKG